MMQAILECKNLTKKFGRKTALDDVSLQLKSGKIYGLLGENGSGKTTWMKLIAGLSKPEKGEIFYEGHPLCAKDKESIAYMATENFFYSYMNLFIFANINYAAPNLSCSAPICIIRIVRILQFHNKLFHKFRTMLRRFFLKSRIIHLRRIICLIRDCTKDHEWDFI